METYLVGGRMETPKLNGWITPEYACDMIRSMLKFLYANQKEDFEYFRTYIANYELAEDIKYVSNL